MTQRGILSRPSHGSQRQGSGAVASEAGAIGVGQQTSFPCPDPNVTVGQQAGEKPTCWAALRGWTAEHTGSRSHRIDEFCPLLRILTAPGHVKNTGVEQRQQLPGRLLGRTEGEPFKVAGHSCKLPPCLGALGYPIQHSDQVRIQSRPYPSPQPARGDGSLTVVDQKAVPQFPYWPGFLWPGFFWPA